MVRENSGCVCVCVCAGNSKLGGSTVFHIPKSLPGCASKRFQVTFLFCFFLNPRCLSLIKFCLVEFAL